MSSLRLSRTYHLFLCADGHPLLTKSRSQSVSTVNTDSESDRPSSTQPDDSLSYTGMAARDSVRSQPRTLVPEDPRVDSLVTKVTAARDNMRREAEDMLVTAEEVSGVLPEGFGSGRFLVWLLYFSGVLFCGLVMYTGTVAISVSLFYPFQCTCELVWVCINQLENTVYQRLTNMNITVAH